MLFSFRGSSIPLLVFIHLNNVKTGHTVFFFFKNFPYCSKHANVDSHFLYFFSIRKKTEISLQNLQLLGNCAVLQYKKEARVTGMEPQLLSSDNDQNSLKMTYFYRERRINCTTLSLKEKYEYGSNRRKVTPIVSQL